MATPNPWAVFAAGNRAAAPAFQPTVPDDGGLFSSFQPVASGLGWVGEVLDKPGRVVRGALGGLLDAATGQDPWDEAREIANIIPFSDTLGITDPNRSTSGRDLLTKLGAPKNNEAWSLSDAPWDVGGFVAEVALDPTTYLTLGGSALSKAGRIAKSAGVFDDALKQAAIKGIGKSTAKQSTTLRQALGGSAENLAKAQRYADKKGIRLDDWMDTPLGGPVGFGLPFMDPFWAATGRASKAASTGIKAFHASPNDIVGKFKMTRGRGLREPTGAFFAPTEELARAATGKAVKGVTEWSLDPQKLLDLSDPKNAQWFDDLSRGFEKDAIQQVSKLTKLPAEESLLDLAGDLADQGKMIAPQDALTQRLRDLGYDAVKYGDNFGQGQIVALTPDIIGKAATAPPPSGLSAAAAKGMDAAGDFIGNLAPVRHGRALFDASVRQAGTKAGQALGRILHGTERAAEEAARGAENEFIRAMQQHAPGIDQAQLRGIAEGLIQPAGLPQKARDALAKMQAAYKDLADRAEAIGLQHGRFYDPTGRLKSYVPRFLSQDAPRTGDAVKDAIRTVRTGDPSRMKRAELFEGMGAEEVNELLRKTAGMDRKTLAATLPGELAAMGLTEDFHRWNKSKGQLDVVGNRSKRLARYIDKLSPETRAEGLFTNDLVADMGQRLNTGARSVGMGEEVLKAVADDSFLAMDKGAKTVPLDKALAEMGFTAVNTKAAAIDYIAKATNKTIEEVGFRLRTEKAALKEAAALLGPNTSVKQAKQILSQGAPGAFRRILELQGKAPTAANIAKLKATMISEDLAKDLTRSMAGVTLPDSANVILKGADALQSAFKAGVLSWPARHVRDFMSSQFRNLESGLVSPQRFPSALANAWKLTRGGDIEGAASIPIVRDILAKSGRNAKDAEGTKVLRELARQFDVAGTKGELDLVNKATRKGTTQAMLEEMPGEIPHSLGKTAKKLVGGEGATWNPLNAKVRGINSDDVTTFAPFAVSDDVGAMTESLNRLTPWLDQISQGVDPAEAAKLVRNAQVDYSSKALTKFERDVMTRLFPFYRFMRGNTPYVLRQLAEKPGGAIAQTVRATGAMQQNSGILPDELASGTAIPLGTNETGAPRYLASLGLMHEDPLGMIGSGVKGGLAKLGGGLNPLLKAPIEWATGQSLFMQRDIDDMDPTLGRIRDNLLYGDAGSFKQADPLFGSDALEFIVGNSPVARLGTTVRTLSDPRKEWPEALLNTLTGARITDVSPSRQDAILREHVTDLLRDHPAGRVFERSYVNQDELAKLPPEEQAKAMQMQAILNALAERAKARKAAE